MGQSGEEQNPDRFNLPGKERHGETYVKSSLKGRNAKQAKTGCQLRLDQNGVESGHYCGSCRMTNRQSIPGSKMAPKAFIIISDMELGNPYAFLN